MQSVHRQSVALLLLALPLAMVGIAESAGSATGTGPESTGSPAATELIDVSRIVTYELTHRTRLRLDEPVETLRVFHPRPMEPSWKPVAAAWVTDVVFSPDDALWQPNPVGGSYWRWEHVDVPAGEYTFQSRFHVTTARRELRTDRLETTWDAVARTARDVPPSRRGERLKVPVGLREVAGEIRARHDNPVDAVVAAAAWIDANIEYSVKVDYGTGDLESIDRERKGWCGHIYTVFRALCQELGIPVRVAVGFNVRNQSGLWNGTEDWNRHTWAEILLPRVGWVEVEPADGTNPFAIPRTYLKNSPDLQSHAIWLRRDGAWSWGGASTTRDTVRIKPVPGSPT